MDADNLVKLFEAMHISDQPPASGGSSDVVTIVRPTSLMLSTTPDHDQLWASSVPCVVGAKVLGASGITSQNGGQIRLESHRIHSKIKELAQKLLTNDTATRLLRDSKLALQD
ncbi:hypothetical protein RRF57_012977 [Xylaria bambusicola]|uniref:Uncharacterized protein n=1 Tax=Xylaria bambusicola TaxID=326684 RepID=A0AAN7Z4Z1_9PEZI